MSAGDDFSDALTNPPEGDFLNEDLVSRHSGSSKSTKKRSETKSPEHRIPAVVEEEPEPELGLGDALGEGNITEDQIDDRLLELNRKLEECVKQRDFGSAWKLEKEIQLTTQLRHKLLVFDNQIEILLQQMSEAAQSQRYIEADQLKEEVECIKNHRQEITDFEGKITHAEIQVLEQTILPDGLHRAIAMRAEVDRLKTMLESLKSKEAKCANLRALSRRAIINKDYNKAEVLKGELQSLKAQPLLDGGSANKYSSYTNAGNPILSYDNIPQQTAGGNFMGPPSLSGVDALGPAFGSVPRYQPNMAASVPVQTPASQHNDNVVSNLAALIWQTSQSDSSALPNSPVDPYFRRRLLSFYQRYNPAKLPSVTQCLQEYQGNEEKLFTALVQKYGPEPPDIMSVPLPQGWRLVESNRGDVFYIHVSGKKQWDRPT
eukprot:TRINITY_DN10350_c0_g1_i1.p1 TRINITY_DN10350_c0_g1~~TRINITY_DN10350_c0_g1_i1.p1  ORF type:complete len:432 (+),score=73.89 TRINITY_DN10350_c0_g1_i1:47-1342(+)